MARPKTAHPHLPAYVKPRRSGAGILYYYQRNGRQIPLGSSYENAEERAALAIARPMPSAATVSDLEELTEEYILSAATPDKSRAGIYFLILNGRISYIGQSNDVLERIAQHRRQRRFDAYYWFGCIPQDLDRMEAACIAKFKPWQNSKI